MKPSPPVVASFVVAFVLRLWLLWAWPTNIGLDGFQRWGGREWVLVQDWLPAAQLVIWSVAKAGGGIFAARFAMATIASLSVAAGAGVAEAVGGRVAAWSFLVAATFGPFLLWSTALYQEGTFLFFLFAGLALALQGRTAAADLVIGAMGLVRYEGWPLVALYVAWRRDPRALLAGWGALVWVVGRTAFAWAGHKASPIDYFEDWVGIFDRFSFRAWWNDALWLSTMAWRCGAWVYAGLAAVGTVVGWRTRGVRLLALMALAQVGVVALWIVGLERATYRMLVIPTMICAFPATIAVAWAFERLPRPWMRPALAMALGLLMGVGIEDAWRNAQHEYKWTHPERMALKQMERCEDCRWWIEPRGGLGPKERHDGCELLQGVSTLRHGEDFYCAAWPEDAGHQADCDGIVAWDGEGYTVTKGAPR